MPALGAFEWGVNDFSKNLPPHSQDHILWGHWAKHSQVWLVPSANCAWLWLGTHAHKQGPTMIIEPFFDNRSCSRGNCQSVAELLPADVTAAHDTSVEFMLHVPHEAGSEGMVQEWHNELASVVVIAVVIVVVAAAFLCLNTLQRMCVASFAGV